MAATTVYLSFDVEADGPAPGVNSMLSIGLCAMYLNGDIAVWPGTDEPVEFSANLLPDPACKPNADTMAWWNAPEQAAALAHVQTNRRLPSAAFSALSHWLVRVRAAFKQVKPCAWPAAYDWQWLNHGLHRHTGGNPLGYSCHCISGFWRGIKKRAVRDGLPSLDAFADARYQHTHLALDDAREQGAKYVGMLRYAAS